MFSDQKNVVFRAPDLDGNPLTIPPQIDYGFKYSELKQSVGVAVQWLAPLGVFRFSYAYPLNAERGDTVVRWEEEVEGFQFSIGRRSDRTHNYYTTHRGPFDMARRVRV